VSDKYLWDRSGPPDPEVVRLEQLLGTLRSTRPASAPVLPAEQGASTSEASADFTRTADLARGADLAGGVDLTRSADLAGRTDLVGSADLARRTDLAGSADLGRRADLAGSADLGRRADLAGSADFARRAELAGGADLTHSADLARRADLVGSADFARRAELAGGADLTHSADLARRADLVGSAGLARRAELAGSADLTRSADGARGGDVARGADGLRSADGVRGADVRRFVAGRGLAVRGARPRTRWFLWPVAAAAAITLFAVGSTWRWTRGTSDAAGAAPGSTPAWSVARLTGAPRVGARHMGDAGRLAVGQWLETDAQGRAQIDVADIGRVHVDPGTRVRLVATRAGEYRLQLAHGTLHALIWAPPGQFFVETPSSTAIDLGCAYTLQVDDRGAGLVRVTSGWVGFEWRGREAFIPAGAVCATRPGVGPGTPYYEDVSAQVRDALTTLDFARATSTTSMTSATNATSGTPAPRDAREMREAREAALTRVLNDARERDAVTLWHLLSRVDPGDERNRVFDRLSALVPPPAGITREGIRAGNREMLDRWWERLGLGGADWWRMWKQPWSEKTKTAPAP
jgi:hypothetical protein